MSGRDIAGIRFLEAGEIRPERDCDGRIAARRPQARLIAALRPALTLADAA